MRGVWGKRGVNAVNSLSVSYTGQVGVQIWGGQKLQRWHDEGPRGYTVIAEPSSSSPAWHVNSERGCVCWFVCFLSGVCLLWCSHSGSLPLTSIKREWCPLPATLRHASSVSGERGPHNLLFVPLLLRKYFLNSSFSVYFYYSCFLPWFTPILSYLFAFQTPVWFIMANLPQKDFKKLLLSWLWTVFICLGEPEGERVFLGYLCVGDSWAEAYKLTPITATSGLNQIPLLQIADMRTDTLSSDVVIYRPGPATLNVKTFLHHVKLMRCYLHGVRCVKWVLSARGAHLRANVTQRDQTLIYSQLWLLCWFWSGSYRLPHTQHTNTHTQIIKEKRNEKAKSLADHWSMTQLSNQIVRLEGPTGPQSCPGPPGVTEQLRGVNVHFSQLSKTCDGGKGKQRRTEVIWPTNIDSLKLINGLSKKLRDGWNDQTSKSPDGLSWYCCRRTFQSAMCDLSVLEFIISMQTSAGWEYMIYS